MVKLWYYYGIIIGLTYAQLLFHGGLSRFEALIYEAGLPEVAGEVVLRYHTDLAKEVDLHLSLHIFCQFCKDFVYILRIYHRFND